MRAVAIMIKTESEYKCIRSLIVKLICQQQSPSSQQDLEILEEHIIQIESVHNFKEACVSSSGSLTSSCTVDVTMVLSSVFSYTYRSEIRRAWSVYELNCQCEKALRMELKEGLSEQQWFLFCSLNVSVARASGHAPFTGDFQNGMLLNHKTGKVHQALTISKRLFLAITSVMENGWSKGSRADFLGSVLDKLQQDDMLQHMIDTGEREQIQNVRASLCKARQDSLEFYIDLKCLQLTRRESHFFRSLMMEQSTSKIILTVFCDLSLTLTEMLAKTLKQQPPSKCPWLTIHAILLEMVAVKLNAQIKTFLNFVIQLCVQKQSMNKVSLSDGSDTCCELYLSDADINQNVVEFR